MIYDFEPNLFYLQHYSSSDLSVPKQYYLNVVDLNLTKKQKTLF